ncbi:MAG: PadR family transcriptional regulator [Christensenellales bacterium]|jgi:PadR family transcriptional regulator PadR
MNIQLKKGILEMLVLAMLDQKDCYGYELVSGISEKVELAERSIYPLLKRLRDEEWVTTYLKESNLGAPRKYYRLTEAGKQALATMKEEWASLIVAVNSLLEEANQDE